MKKHTYIFCAACALLSAVSCLRGDLDVTPTPGEEVQFGVTMSNGSQTKTLYGADNENAIKIKWVNGDRIMIFGTTCSDECNTAEYSVAVAGTNLPNQDDATKQTGTISKVEKVGLRWGSAATSDFIGIYPSKGATFSQAGETVTATASISSTQNYVFNDAPTQRTIKVKDDDGVETTQTIDVWEGTHYGSDIDRPSMENAIMYARTNNAASGSNVSLNFEPANTALRFRFMGFDRSITGTNADEIIIQSVTITAPAGCHIAGDFRINVPKTGNISAESMRNSTNKNSVTIVTRKKNGSYLKLTNKQAAEFSVFMVPLSGLSMSSTNLWTVSIQIQGRTQPSVYKLIPSNGGKYDLEPCFIHKVKVPALKTLVDVEFKPDSWIEQIPGKVYLSELSVPGAWYAGDLATYQNGASLSELYNIGVRAFNIDCRMSPSSFDVDWRLNKTYGPLQLVCAGTDKWDADPGWATILYNPYKAGTTVLKTLQTIASLIDPNKKEYVVVVLTICEKPLTSSDTAYGGATVDPAQVIPAINSLLSTYGESLKVFGYYGDTKGKSITHDTTVEEANGTMIVKINSNTDALGSYTFPANSMVSFASMASDPDYNKSNDNITDLPTNYFSAMQNAPIYWGNNQESSLTYYYHQAQRTTQDNYSVSGVPTLAKRKTAIDDIINKSYTIYTSGHHNGWFQMGIGGYIKNTDSGSTSQDNVANSLNPYLYGKIMHKMDTDPSPVGVVLMNNATSTTKNSATVDGVSYSASSQDLVRAIIEMNSKFYLNREEGGDVGGGSISSETTIYDAFIGVDSNDSETL